MGRTQDVMFRTCDIRPSVDSGKPDVWSVAKRKPVFIQMKLSPRLLYEINSIILPLITTKAENKGPLHECQS